MGGNGNHDLSIVVVAADMSMPATGDMAMASLSDLAQVDDMTLPPDMTKCSAKGAFCLISSSCCSHSCSASNLFQCD